MASGTIATLLIDPDSDGKFWLSLEGQEDLGRKGPFETEEEAAEMAVTFLEETFAKIAEQALGGDTK